MDIGEEKQRQWTELASQIQRLLEHGTRGLRRLPGEALMRLIDDYQALAADLARARSLNAPSSIVNRLNRIAAGGHILLYGHMRSVSSRARVDLLGGFARAVRQSAWAVGLAAAMLLGPALIAYFAVQMHPHLGYDLVPSGFLEFDPARPESLHDIPSLVRPIASSAIMANNIQVSLVAFGFGLTAGVGTTWVLIFNGIHVGAIAGWMTLHGRSRPLWGWIMPHGGTELLAICLAGAAGYVLAGAIIAPGQQRRATALKAVGGRALAIELGVVAMLVLAGAIEGFVSPSRISFEARLAVLGGSLTLWAAYFLLVGRRHEDIPPDDAAASGFSDAALRRLTGAPQRRETIRHSRKLAPPDVGG
jgi:uncharacterized membrane protein SpoIIM required for sporulation